MLNISEKDITEKDIDLKKYKSYAYVESKKTNRTLLQIIGLTFLVFLISMFLPWTQNIHTNGTITTLKPGQRPQTIQSMISGRVEKWYVQEGDYVKKGDTILFISEIKNEYLDPNLLNNTKNQINSKSSAVKAYQEKVNALNNQASALIKTAKLKEEEYANKLKQTKLLIISDSMAHQAAIINYDIAKAQFKRMEELQKEGLKPLTDLEKRNKEMQKAQADLVFKENKFLASKNKAINVVVSNNATAAQYREKIAKSKSDKFTAFSSMYDAEVSVSRLKNKFSNYNIRSNMYYITSPQNGYVTKTIQSGIGETIKQGSQIVSIMPENYELAIEMYIKPIDLPLVQIDENVRIQFDGWPAIVFSGWPTICHGTYGGTVYAIDQFISDNGMYRVLVATDKDDHDWPDALRVGGGTRNLLLLNKVSVWYELWRSANGFPPDYYVKENKK
ncbi:MAG: biotin/lipoyl-binding protein [Flavobacteriaceae bacterium]|nr:biotin/lipoyl-binding protein [Flavobacteriaceae bacterium]